MNTLDTIKQRRATKAFHPEHRLSEEELRSLLSAGALAPSSFNMQNRHFIAVTDAATKVRLRAAAWGQEHVEQASVVIVLTGSLKAYQNTGRYLRNAPPEVRAMFEPMVEEFYGDKPSIQRDEACRSVGLAAMNLMLAAEGMGYSSCPMIGFDPAQVSEILGLDEDHPPLMIVVVGQATKAPWPRLGLLDLEEVVSLERFGNHALKGAVQA